MEAFADSGSDWLQRCAVAVQSAAIGQTEWVNALAIVREALGAAAAALETWNYRRHAEWGFVTSGMDVAGAARVHALFPETNPRLEASEGMGEGDVAYDYLHWTEQQLSRMDFVRALEEHTGTRYFLGGIALKTRDHLGAVTFFREPRQGHFSSESIARLRAFLPILRMALQTSIAMDQQRTLAGLAVGEGAALLLLNASGRVVFANAEAQRLEQKGLIAGLGGDDVRCHSGRCNLASLAQQALHGSPGAARIEDLPGGRVLEVRGIPLASVAQPLEPFHASAALIISDPLAKRNLDPATLRSLFHFSDREQQVAQLLLAGRSAAEIALELSISRETVRVHLRKLLEKTGTHSQREFVTRLSQYR
jgi:DNA-binding CsgD family transcriptional regulator